MKLLAISFISIFLCAACLNAQDKESITGQGFGLSASLRGADEMEIMVPIFLSEKFSLAPSLGYNSVEGGASDLSLGVTGHLYINRARVAPFLSARFGLLIASPKEGDSVTDVVFGLGGGGEYFISRYFSVGVEAQVNISKSSEDSNRFNNPGGTTFSTASAIFATVYF